MKRRHLISWIVAIVILIIVVLFFLTPTLLSTRPGTRLIERTIDHHIPGTVTIHSIRLRWTGPQTASGVTILSPRGQAVVSVKTVTISASLWRLLWGSTHLGAVQLEEPVVDVVYDTYGSSSLREAIGRTFHGSSGGLIQAAGFSKIERAPKRRIYTGTFSLTHGSIHTQLPEVAPVVFQDVESVLSIPRDLAAASFSVSATAAQGERSGTLLAQMQQLQIRSQEPGPLLVPTAEFLADVKISDFPTAGLDALTAILYPKTLGLLTHLLGSSLNLQFEVSGPSKGKGIHLQAAAPHLEASLDGTIRPEELTLDQPASLQLHITPKASTKLFPLFPRGRHLSLVEPTLLTIQIPALRTVWKGRQLIDLEGAGQFVVGKSHLRHPFTGPFLVDSLTVDGVARGRDKVATLDGQIGLTRSELTGKITAHGESQAFLTENAQLSFTLNSNRFPTPLFEPFVHGQGFLPDLLGSWLTLKVSGVGDRKALVLTAEANSPMATLSPTRVIVGSNIELIEPSEVRLLLGMDGWDRLIGNRATIELVDAAELALEIREFRMPRALSVLPSQVHLLASFSGPRIHVSGVPGQGVVTLHDLHAVLRGKSLANAEADMVVDLFLPGETGYWLQALGDNIPITLQALVEVASDWTFNFSRLFLWLHPRLLSLTAEASLTDYRYLKLLNPIQAHYTLTPSLLRAAPSPALLKPVEIAMQIDPWAVDLANFELWRAKASGHLSVAEAQFAGPEAPRISNLKADVVVNDPPNTLRTAFQGQADRSDGNKSGTLKGTLALSDFFSPQGPHWAASHLEADATLQRLPTAALGFLLGQEQLEEVLGAVTNLQMEIDLQPVAPPQGKLTAKLEGDRLLASGSVAIEKAVTLANPEQPIVLQWKITPQALDVVTEWVGYSLPFALEGPTQLSARIDSLEWPLHSADYRNAVLGLRADIPQATLIDRRVGQMTGIRNLQLAVNTQGQGEPIALKAQGELRPLPSGEVGTFAFAATSELGQPLLNLNGTLSLNSLPTPLLLHLMPIPPNQANPLAILLGNSLSATAKWNFREGKGPLDFEVSAQKARAQVQGYLQNRELRLVNPFVGAAQITPEFGALILQALNPLLVSTLRSEDWANLRIEPDGFSLPILPLDLNRLSIGSGQLDLGKLWLANRDTVAILLSLFPASHASGEREIRVWTTPVPFRAAAGVVSIDRADILLDRTLQVACWGGVDLGQNRVKLTLAVPGYSLRKVLGLKGIPDDEYLLLPVRGSLQESKIDYAPAAAGVAAIVAKAQGKVAGALTGAAIDLLSGAAKKKQNIPPPTMQPFPWAGEVRWPPYELPEEKK